MGRLTMRYEGGETNYLKYNGGTITDYRYQHGIDRLAEYEDIGTPQELAELKAENAELKARLEKAVELPCKPLSNVWFISRNHLNCGLLIGAQTGFVDGLPFNDIINFRVQCGLKTYHANDIFLTRKEAEARLNELKGEMGNEMS